MQLTFASYNIHKAVGTDRRRDPDRIIRVLREMDADVIALQEADLRIGERPSVLSRAALDDTPWKAVPVARRPRSLGWHGNALLVRRGFDIVEAHALDLPTLEPRGAVMADIAVEGVRIRVVGTHLDLSGLLRRAQIAAILGHIAAGTPACPTVVMGDFNQWGNRTGAMRKFGAEWNILNTGLSFPSHRPIARLDRIVATLQWECVRAEVHHTATASQASDHLPIIGELMLLDK